MNRAIFGFLAVWTGGALVCPAPAGAQGIRPKALLVYYGYPSAINNTWSVPAAAQEFGRYQYVLWGAGLDDPMHPDHSNAVAIASDPATAQTRFYGYVDIGVSTRNLPMSEIQTQLTRWHSMGMDGVQFDNFGYDFGTSRARQNAAVDSAHALGLAVIANAFWPEDAFGSAADPVYNPIGAAPRLGAADFYLYESYAVRLGQFEDEMIWRQHSDSLEVLRGSMGFRVLSCTSSGTDDPGAYDGAAFSYAWHVALLYGHEATGWGEYGYSASGVSNGQAPFRDRPTLDPGNAFTGPVVHDGSLHSRLTDGGRLEVDSATHQYGFYPSSTAVPGGSGGPARTLGAFPNPSRGAMRFSFALDRPSGAHLTVYDAVGRRVATLRSSDLSSGQHETWWSGLDGAGELVAPGSYFVVLESGGSRSLARFVIAR
jgi:hypothetical protein